MNSESEHMLYRVILVHNTFDHVKISVEFPERPHLSAEQQWIQALNFLGLPKNEFKLESASPLGLVRV